MSGATAAAAAAWAHFPPKNVKGILINANLVNFTFV